MTEKLRDKLHGEGFRLTRERQVILSFLEAAKGHHDAVEIHQQLRANGHRISLATVYRTLNLFSELKAIERLFVEGQPCTYEINGADQGGRPHHYHLVCRVCGRVMDMDPGPLGASMQELEETLPQTYDFRVTGHQLTFFGVCDRCASS